MLEDEGTLYGRGFHFPPGIGPGGQVAYSVAAENIRQSIRVILLTEPRERLMLPEFGAGLKRFLFQPNSASTHRLIAETITRALGRWERRIKVQSVDVAPDPDDEKAALAVIRYQVIATRAQESFQMRVQLAP